MPHDSGNIDGVAPRTHATSEHGRVLGAEIKRLWDDLYPTYQLSRDKILLCQDVQAGRDETLATLPPDTFDDSAADRLVVQLPQRKTLPLNLTNVLLEKDTPVYSRYAIGRGQKANDAADLLEKWLNVAGDPDGDHEKTIKKGTQQGEYCVLVYPTPAHYLACPDYLDEIDEDELGDLNEKDRSAYSKHESGRYRRVQDNTPQPKRRFVRDAKGKTPDDDGYEGVDTTKSKQAWKDEQLEYLASHFPITVRILSATEYIPVYGPGYVIKGILVRTLYTTQQLIQQKYAWGTRAGKDGALQIPGDPSEENNQGVGKQWYLYEFHSTTTAGDPYISYSCGGYETAIMDNDQETEPYVDLRAEYGQRELLADIQFGLHLDELDPSSRGIPYLEPFLHPILNAEEAMTNTQVYLRRTAYPAFGLKVDPNMPDEKYLETNGTLRTFQIPQGGGVVMTPGDLVPLGPGQVSPQVFALVDRFMSQIDENTPASTVYGGGNPSSGRETVVSRGALLGANRMILEGARRAFEFRGSAILKVACALIKKFGTTIPVPNNVELGPEDGGAKRRELLELNVDWVGSVYDVKAKYKEADASLAEQQLAMDAADRGYGTFEEVRAKMGDQSPDTTRAKIFNDFYYKPGQPGYTLVAERAAKLRNDKAELERMELEQQRRLTPNGTPTAALAPPQGGNGMTDLPNFAASSLGGQVAGAMQTGAEMGDTQAVAALQGR